MWGGGESVACDYVYVTTKLDNQYWKHCPLQKGVHEILKIVFESNWNNLAFYLRSCKWSRYKIVSNLARKSKIKKNYNQLNNM